MSVAESKSKSSCASQLLKMANRRAVLSTARDHRNNVHRPLAKKRMRQYQVAEN